MSGSSPNEPAVTFVVEGEPEGKGRPRVTKHGTYTPKKTKVYEERVQWAYRHAADGFRFGDIEMIKLEITAYYGIAKSKTKTMKKLMKEGKVRPTKKPDTDNVIKVVADALNGIAYRDDAQIVDTVCRKYFSEEPRVEVTLTRAIVVEEPDLPLTVEV